MTRHNLKTTILAFTIGCLMGVLPTTASAQYAPQGDCAGQCGTPGCQGRCQYCVDGQCIPRRETFGYYQTQWRRWPIAPPTVAAPMPPTGSDMNIDLPSITDEGSTTPDLRHRRTRAGQPGVEPPADDGGMDPFMDEGAMPEPAAADPDMGAAFPPPSQSRMASRNRSPIVGNPLRGLSPVPPSHVLRVGYNQPLEPAPRRLAPRTPNPLRR